MGEVWVKQTLMEEASLRERNRIEAEIRVVNLALRYFRRALEVEKQM